jgi:hypothetical protein
MHMEVKRGVVAEHAESIRRDPAAHAFDLFVIYAAADADFVRGYLLPALNLPPPRVLLVDRLTPGAPLVSEIERGVCRSRFTVAVLSPAYLEDRWAVFGELLASYLSIDDVHVIPLRLANGKFPLRLEARVALDFTDRRRWESEAARLRELLHTRETAAEQIPCPYPGMRPFATDDASWFFGRDKELGDLVGRLDHGEREIYVIGPSGSGKSSLVQAGLLHALEAGSSRLQRLFVVRMMRPGERPSDRLANALDGDLAMPAVTVGALVAQHPPAERVLVFVDQLEEIFTRADEAERRRFIATLRTLRAVPRCYLLLALRADFFGALTASAVMPELAERISRLKVGRQLARSHRAPRSRALGAERCGERSGVRDRASGARDGEPERDQEHGTTAAMADVAHNRSEHRVGATSRDSGACYVESASSARDRSRARPQHRRRWITLRPLTEDCRCSRWRRSSS